MISNFMRKTIVPVLGLSAAALVLLLITPRAVHAVVATLVQIANTPANPVPSAEVNAPGEEAFQTQLCSESGTFYSCGGIPSEFVVPASTADGSSVKRLVLTTVAGNCEQNPGTNILTAEIGTSAGSTPINYFSPLQQNPTLPSLYSIVGPAPLYADPGSGIFATASVSGGGNASCVYDLAGYYVTH